MTRTRGRLAGLSTSAIGVIGPSRYLRAVPLPRSQAYNRENISVVAEGSKVNNGQSCSYRQQELLSHVVLTRTRPLPMSKASQLHRAPLQRAQLYLGEYRHPSSISGSVSLSDITEIHIFFPLRVPCLANSLTRPFQVPQWRKDITLSSPTQVGLHRI